MSGTNALLSAFDVDDIEPEALLFQTGYLTITGEEDVGGLPLFRLGYPNREVRQSLNEHLLRVMTPARVETTGYERSVARAARRERLRGGRGAVPGIVFASIPYEWHTRNEIARYEGYYASVFYSHFAAAGVDVTVEDSSSRGRVDMSVRLRRATCTCSSSRWSTQRRTGASDGPAEGEGLRGQVPTSGTSRSTWWRWSSAGRPAIWPPL